MSSLPTTQFTQVTDHRSRLTARSCEVSGQCSACLDFFTLSVYLVHGQPAIADTPRVKWMPDPDDEGELTLIHRPELCHAKVKLYGSLEKLSLAQDAHYILPRSGQTRSSRRTLASTRHGTLQTNGR